MSGQGSECQGESQLPPAIRCDVSELFTQQVTFILCRARLLESAGILPFSCQERRGDDSPGWRQARPTAVGWEGGWGYAVTGQLSDSVRRR